MKNTINIHYKVFGAKGATKEITEVTRAAHRLEAALDKLDKRGIKIQFKASRTK
jgi:hypothetical protein